MQSGSTLLFNPKSGKGWWPAKHVAPGAGPLERRTQNGRRDGCACYFGRLT